MLELGAARNDNKVDTAITVPRLSANEVLPGRITALPEMANQLSMEVDEVDDVDDDEEDDLDEVLVRHRLQAARTLFHEPREDNDTINSTRSLYDTDVVYVYINGRRYSEDYYMPNDEDEQTRMQMLDLIFYHMLDDQLTTVPLEDPRKILDIGTGIGHWAIDMAEMYPKAEVIGIDIAKIQPTGVPVNVFFNIDNAEADGGWTWPDNEFDLVHLRSMGGAFQDWDHIYKEAFKHLKPGGWIEVLDFDNLELLQSYFAKDSVVAAWFQAVNEATIKSGFLRGDVHLQDYCLTRVGFANVSTTTKKIPLGAWPRDSQEKKVGKHFLVTQLSGIEAVCLRLFTEQLDWDVEKVNEICSATMKLTRAVAMNPKKSHGLGFNMRILVGRKPSGPEVFNDSDDASKVGSSLRTVVNGYSTNTL